MGVFSIFDFYKYENTKSIFLFIEIFTVVKGEMLLTFHLILDVYPKLVINGMMSFFTHTIIGISFFTYVETCVSLKSMIKS